VLSSFINYIFKKISILILFFLITAATTYYLSKFFPSSNIKGYISLTYVIPSWRYPEFLIAKDKIFSSNYLFNDKNLNQPSFAIKKLTTLLNSSKVKDKILLKKTIAFNAYPTIQTYSTTYGLKIIFNPYYLKLNKNQLKSFVKDVDEIIISPLLEDIHYRISMGRILETYNLFRIASPSNHLSINTLIDKLEKKQILNITPDIKRLLTQKTLITKQQIIENKNLTRFIDDHKLLTYKIDDNLTTLYEFKNLSILRSLIVSTILTILFIIFLFINRLIRFNKNKNEL